MTRKKKKKKKQKKDLPNNDCLVNGFARTASSLRHLANCAERRQWKSPLCGANADLQGLVAMARKEGPPLWKSCKHTDRQKKWNQRGLVASSGGRDKQKGKQGLRKMCRKLKI
jgi:hypothetical protein